MAIKVQQSKHADYAWEVYASKKHFGKLIKKGFKTKREAERFKNELAAKERTQTIPIDPAIAVMVARFQADLTLEQMEAALMEKREQVGQTSIDFTEASALYNEHLDRLVKRKAIGVQRKKDLSNALIRLNASLGNPKLSEIDKEMLEEYVDDQLDMPGHNGTKSPRTIKNSIEYLSTFLNHAVREKWTSKNATKEITLGHYKPHVHILKPAEIQKLLDNSTWLMRAFIMFGAFGGCRSSEIPSLRWEDVRLDEGQFYIPGKKNVCAERWVNLTPPLRDYCEQMLTPPKNASANWERTGLVLRNSAKSTIQRHRDWLVEKAGMEIPRNALRHSFGSHHLVQYGNPMVTAVELGHYSPQTTFAHYRQAVRKTQAKQFWDVRLGGAALEEDLPGNIIAA